MPDNNNGKLIVPLKFWSQPILPTVYSESLSYLEDISHVVQKLNEVVAAMNSFSDSLAEYVDGKIAELDAKYQQLFDDQDKKVDEKLAELQGYVDDTVADLTKKFDDFQAQVNGDIDDLKKYVDTNVTQLTDYVNLEVSKLTEYVNKTVSDLVNKVNMQIDDIYALIEQKDKDVRDWVRIEIDKILSQIPEITQPIVRNPITGVYEPLQDTLDAIVSYLSIWSLSASEYDNLELTADEYDSKKITALDYDLRGVDILRANNMLWMRHPATGENVFYQDVIYWLASFHQEPALTAQGYDALELTAQVYDDKQITAYDYDFAGIPA